MSSNSQRHPSRACVVITMRTANAVRFRHQIDGTVHLSGRDSGGLWAIHDSSVIKLDRAKFVIFYECPCRLLVASSINRPKK